jgi:2-hydroxy-6-oxonona-2,4-dienedioate hydrolase/2-hydroxy-6-oxo-6-(2'-carboxyphenyl)-hexa-2,4-dienoate hydrolase
VNSNGATSFWSEGLGAQVRFIDAGGWRTRVIDAGEGDPVLMMPGLTGHAEAYLRNVVPLADHGYHVYALDMVGHGFSDKPPDLVYGTATFTTHLQRFLDAIDAESAHLVGQSLGGWVAWRFALEHPERVRSLVSLTGAGFLLDDDESQRESEAVGDTVRQRTNRALEKPTRERVRERLEWLMFDPHSVTDELVEARYRIFNLPDSMLAMPKMTNDFAGPDNRASMLTERDLAKINNPALIIWTDHNPTTPAAVGERVSHIMPNARFAMVHDAAHWPMFEQPAIVNKMLASFLKEVCASGGVSA